MNRILLLLCFLSVAFTLPAQHLQPGFDKAEFLELLRLSARQADSAYFMKLPEPRHFVMTYRSPVVGLDNRWDLWVCEDSTAVISIRGSVRSATSWLANFYAAMAPAKGRLQLSDGDYFDYQLAKNPRAAVHVGWLAATAFLSRDIVPKIKLGYGQGVDEFLITGHSQGGAIAYLLTAYLYNLQERGELPADIRFKTYCSAAPKPGNLYFAYEYEHKTAGGWAFNVVNSADWVPETPISIQTLDDFNETNPFDQAREVIKQQKFPQRVALNFAYNKLDKPTRKARENYQKFLGEMTTKSIQEHLEGFEPPAFFESNHYVRTGRTIVLFADEAYYQRFPDNDEEPFVHHVFEPYLYLAEQLEEE